jgi:hypothetical protein
MSEHFIPLLAFFIAFFIAFLVIELVIIYMLNRLGKRYWAFVIDTLIRDKVHHGKAIEMIAAAGVIVILAFIWFLTPFFGVLGAATPVIKTFSLILLVAMAAVYFTATRKTIRMALEKKVHQYIYFVLSLIIFAFMVIMADQGYNAYQNYVQSQFVKPAVQTIESTIDKQEEERLITQFKEDYLAGRCKSVDYTEDLTSGLTHFVYIKTDKKLATDLSKPVEEGMPYLKGQKCTDGENTFLLNEEGKWYWVITEKTADDINVFPE